MNSEIRTTAEATEEAAMPRIHEVHTGNEACPKIPEQMQKPPAGKSAARWAYERMILYIRNFEEQLDSEQEIAMGFAGGDAGILRIEGMGYFDPDIITFYGTDPTGGRTQLVQHVSQLSVLLRALPKKPEAAKANRIGFRLAADLQET